MADANLTKFTDVQARAIDIATRFATDLEELLYLQSTCDPISVAPGTVLTTKKAQIALESGAVGPGEDIPLSAVTVKEEPYKKIELVKHKKGVTLEDIQAYGYDVAVAMGDDALLAEEEGAIYDKYFAFLQTGTLTAKRSTFQMALSAAQGLVLNKFKQMKKRVTGTIAYVNVLDVYDYIGAANITVQTANGMQYVKDFMGFSAVFLVSEIPAGTVVATAMENVRMYHFDMAHPDFQRAGLTFETDGETNLVGIHCKGNMDNLTSETECAYGVEFMCEYLDGIAVVTIGEEEEAAGEAEAAG